MLLLLLDQLLVTKDPYEYKSICQGVVTVDNLDDAAELLLTDVSVNFFLLGPRLGKCLCF